MVIDPNYEYALPSGEGSPARQPKRRAGTTAAQPFRVTQKLLDWLMRSGQRFIPQLKELPPALLVNFFSLHR